MAGYLFPFAAGLADFRTRADEIASQEAGKAPSGTPGYTHYVPITYTIDPSKFDYPYDQILGDSFLFFEAQRSGAITAAPGGNRIPWRKDQLLKDGQDVGLDLSGGYYEAGSASRYRLACGRPPLRGADYTGAHACTLSACTALAPGQPARGMWAACGVHRRVMWGGNRERSAGGECADWCKAQAQGMVENIYGGGYGGGYGRGYGGGSGGRELAECVQIGSR
jgi:hypothetical protein